MKKVLMPILLLLSLIVVLIGAATCYEKHYGSEGPFQSEHGHQH
jgi:uncharacterized protein YxeA